MDWLAIDVGGANLKAADGLRYAASEPFALWRAPEELPQRLRNMFAQAPPFDRLSVTMTGELADCFGSSAEGVRRIVDAACSAAGDRPALVYRTDGSLADPGAVRASPHSAAAGNWHALASFAARYCNEATGLLIDAGSTTVDLIPIVAGAPAPAGRTDVDRLASGELVYCGIERTPVAALIDRLPLGDVRVPIASELFATTADAYLLLGDLPEDASNCDTPDGRPRTMENSHRRLARMLCCDSTIVARDQALTIAQSIAAAQLRRLQQAARQVLAAMPAAPTMVILSGHGEFVARRLAERTLPHARVVSLSSELGPALSRCAPAHALAVIARERSSL